MFDPKSIRMGIKNSPRKAIIYGPPKIGKTTLAASALDALLITTEDRVDHISTCAKTEVIKNFDEIIEIFEYLVSGAPYRTAVIDTMDWMEPLLHEYICRKKGFKSLTDDSSKEVNYGRGMKNHAVEGWKMFLQNCDVLRENANMSIILVAHSAIEKVSPPDSDAYDRYTLKVDKNAVAVLSEWADIIGFYSREILIRKEDVGFNKTKGKAISLDDRRILNLAATSPSWLSGNSFGLVDVVVTLDQAPEIMQYVLNVQEEKLKSKKGEKQNG
jgi:hypothetical protein